jgi:hydrogenase nickel incorporation protein HypA/HybF
MHELSITQNIVAIVSDAAKGQKVRRVTLDIGELSGVTPDAIAFCFDVVAKGTALDGAVLDIHRIKGLALCRTCGARFATDTIYQSCACGSLNIQRLAGEELKIREMELEEV